jgi:NDP-sugar pyrophosphorylase family protein
MILVNGKPILEHNIDKCRKFGIDEIYINLHHLPEVIINYFGNGEKFGVKIKYILEPKLLGTAGTAKYFIENIRPKEKFILIYGDNLTEFPLVDIMGDSIIDVAFHYRENVSNSGVAQIDNTGRIISFIEKPSFKTKSHWVNSGVYHVDSEIRKYIKRGFCDFSKDVFPKLLKLGVPFHGHIIERCLAFDTPEMLKENIIN